MRYSGEAWCARISKIRRWLECESRVELLQVEQRYPRGQSAENDDGEAAMAQQLGNIRGRKVISADALEIGEIVDIIVETVAWRVESLQVKVRKEAAEKIGVSRGVLRGGTFNLPVELIQSVGDSIVLSASSTELRNSLVQAKHAAAGGK